MGKVIIRKSSTVEQLKKDVLETGDKKVTESIVILLLDISGSMDEPLDVDTKIEVLKEAIRAFVGMKKDVAIGIITFSNSYKIETVPTRDTVTIIDKVNRLCPEDMTAMGKAIRYALKYIKTMVSYSPRIVLVSDGNVNDMSPVDVLGIVNEFKGKVVIDTIAVGREMMDDFELMKKISEITGGMFFTCSDKHSIVETFKEISPERRYLLR